LADNHFRIIYAYFEGINEKEQLAFELFAQGRLFGDGLDKNGKPRRPQGTKI
jgi:hypothetical protein